MDNMQLWLSSSTDSINLNDSAEGFYLNPDLEGLTGLPEIRSINGLNAGYDGGWTATQLWAARLITIRGVIALNDKAAVETKRKALAKLMAQGKNESLQLKFVSESGNVYTTSVRTTYCTMALKRVFWRQEYQIQLRADDPLIYDDGGAELVAILRVMAGVNGFEIPFEIPFAIGDSADPTDVNVGDEATYPLITLKGDLHSPTIVNLTTNQQMQVLADIITHVEWKAYTTAQTIDGYLKIQDGLQDAPLTLSTLQGNATQKTLSGKNLVPYPAMSGDTTVAGVQFTQSADGKVVASGNSTTGMNWYFTNAFYPTESGSYTLSFTGTLSANLLRLYCYDLTSSTVAMQCYSTMLSQTGTLTAGHRYQIYFNKDASQAGTATTINGYVQLEKGNQATAYEEYCGGTPSPNPSYPQTVNVVAGEQTVKITGKNILPTITGSATQSGVSLTSTNGNITASGTATANMTFTLTGTDGITYRQAYWQTITASATNSVLLQKGTYYFSAGTTTAGNVSTQYRLVNLGQKLEDGTSISLNSSFTITEPKRLCITIYVNNGNAPNVNISELQIEYGNQASAYEAYQAQSQEINLGGSNIFDISSAIMANIYMNTNGWTSASNDWIGTDSYIEVEPNTTYTLSSSATAGTQVAINQYTSQSRSSFISPRIGTATFTTSATAKYISFSIKDPNATNIMLNKGSTAQPYVPYTTYTYELAKIGTYQDYIWNDGCTWYIRRAIGKVVFDGSEDWAISNTGTDRFFYRVNNIISNIRPTTEGGATSDLLMSNIGTPNGVGNTNTVQGIFIIISSAEIRIRYGTEMALVDWKAKLATTNMVLYYALATPTDTEITDSELIEQLNHIYELYQGTNNLWLIPSAGAQGEMGVSYATDKDVDYHEVVIDCQARTVTQDGQNLYPALAPGSEFIRLVPGQNRLYLTSTVSSDDGTAEVKFKKGNISI